VQQDFIWTFARDGEHLTITRRESDETLLVVQVADQQPRNYHFTDPDVLRMFQHDMERFLLQTGWMLHHFSPEQRRGRDRRGFPRLEERRRWWTDGTSPRQERDSDSEDELVKPGG
jgi:hypothetical protein